MATLSAIFRLTDNYSSALNRITSGTTSATSSISRASAATDNLNSQFAASSNATNALTSKLTTLIGTLATFATIKKAMDISDEYTNTNSKLSLITNSLTQQKALQEQIFAAADRARGSYSTMADTVAKLGITNMSEFGNTDKIVKFTETMQKMFKIGGTSTAGQSGAMLQLQQAIGLGKLQGQDLKVLEEDAPIVEKALAKYMNTSTGSLMSLGTAGKITSQTLINSILSYSATADAQMSKMSYTWGDYWNMIKNGATKAFGGVFAAETSVLGSNSFKNTVNGIIGSFTVLANVANKVLGAVTSVFSFISTNWSIIAPIIGGITTAFLLYNGVLLTNNIIQGISNGLKNAAAVAAVAHGTATAAEAAATTGMTAAQIGFNVALYACPLTWILGLIIALIASLYIVVAVINKVTGSTISATGMIVGDLYVLKAALTNLALWFDNLNQGTYYAFIAVILNIKTAFTNSMIGAQSKWLSFVNIILTGVQTVANALNSLPFVNIDTSSLSKTISSNAASIAKLNSNKSSYADVGAAFQKGYSTNSAFASGWDTTAYAEGYKVGTGIDSSISGLIDKITNPDTGTTSNPTTVTGTGTSGAVTVNIADQDLQYLRDLAEKDYVNKFSTAVLSPKISVRVSNATSTQSNDELAKTISGILSNEVATSAEGSYT